MSEVLESLRAISLHHLGLGAAFTVGSFICLTGSDTLAIRYTGRDLPYRKIALASFTALSIGHTLGFAALSSGAIRYRFYTGWGLSPGDLGRIVLFCAMTVAVGLATTGGLASLIEP
ncbi:MAG: lysylphosphatidylglycerol synthase transmembrane domain-containing protein, partial [Dehalococcoidia bacterium]